MEKPQTLSLVPRGRAGRLSPLGWILALGCLLGCQPRKEATPPVIPRVEGERISFPTNAPQLAYLAAETVEPRPRAVLHFNGRLVWDDDETVRMFSPFAGRVSRILREVGQPVAKSDPLAVIESPDFGQAEADARQAVGAFTLAERTLHRVEELLAHGAAAQKDLDAAQSDQVRAQAEVQRALSRVVTYGGNTNAVDQLFRLKTPIAGIVVERNINPGQEVRSDQMLANAPQLFAPLFVVSDPTRLWVWLDVTELDMASLKPGQAIQVRSRAYPDRTFAGRIDVVGDTLDPATRMVKVRGVVENGAKLLKAEMYVTVDVDLEAQAVMDVSSRAVFMKGNQYYVFVEDSPGHYERRAVRLGTEYEGKSAVLEGLRRGERVVTEGALQLRAILEAGSNS